MDSFLCDRCQSNPTTGRGTGVARDTRWCGGVQKGRVISWWLSMNPFATPPLSSPPCQRDGSKSFRKLTAAGPTNRRTSYLGVVAWRIHPRSHLKVAPTFFSYQVPGILSAQRQRWTWQRFFFFFLCTLFFCTSVERPFIYPIALPTIGSPWLVSREELRERTRPATRVPGFYRTEILCVFISPIRVRSSLSLYHGLRPSHCPRTHARTHNDAASAHSVGSGRRSATANRPGRPPPKSWSHCVRRRYREPAPAEWAFIGVRWRHWRSDRGRH